MSQASNVISLPVEKITFEAIKIDSRKALATYEGHKPFIQAAIAMATLSPAGLKKRVAQLEGSSKSETDTIPNLIDDFETLSEALCALAELVVSVRHRLIAVNAKLI